MDEKTADSRLRRALAMTFVVLGLSCAMCADAAEVPVTNSAPEEAASTLTFVNRRICRFRGTLDGYSPEERAAAAKARLDSVLEKAKTMLVTTQAVEDGIQVSLDGKSLFIVAPSDVASIRGQTLESKAAAVATALRESLHELHSLSTPRQVVLAVGKALLGYVYFAGLFWAARRGKRWVLTHATRLVAERTKNVKLHGLRTAALRVFVGLLRAVLNFGSYLFVAFLVYALLWYELRCFPYSRPWGDLLRSQCLAALAALGHSIMVALPDVLVVALIFLAVRMVVQVLSRVFAVAEQGKLQTRLVDPLIVATTRRILVFLLWALGIVVAYPYIPGSQSLAFKGLTVFAGVVVSFGSTNLVNQVASGLLLIYSRAFRVGDYVRVAETEGSVCDIGLCVTRIHTIKNEEVHIANSVLLGAATINYSKLARAEGVFLGTKVTIGYSTPWRQVHAMLLQAASVTAGLAQNPPPFVLQTGLSDFYVEYELNVRIEKPERRAWVLSELNSRVQDVFNEHGVQIMSPHYFADPPAPQVVPKSNWFLAPAKAHSTDNNGLGEAKTDRGAVTDHSASQSKAA